MRRAGFVLVGGASSRMGRDKALLPYQDTVLAECVAREVEKAAGSAMFVGPSERYNGLSRRVIPDLRPGNGPLGGLEAALAATNADWNLIVACDMPQVSAPLFLELFERAEVSGADCLVPHSAPGRPEPLCAVYHRRCLSAAQVAIDHKILKMNDFLARLNVAAWSVSQPRWPGNVNTPEEFKAHQILISRKQPAEQS